MYQNKIVPVIAGSLVVGIILPLTSCKTLTTNLTANMDGGKEVSEEEIVEEKSFFDFRPGRMFLSGSKKNADEEVATIEEDAFEADDFKEEIVEGSGMKEESVDEVAMVEVQAIEPPAPPVSLPPVPALKPAVIEAPKIAKVEKPVADVEKMTRINKDVVPIKPVILEPLTEAPKVVKAVAPEKQTPNEAWSAVDKNGPEIKDEINVALKMVDVAEEKADKATPSVYTEDISKSVDPTEVFHRPTSPKGTIEVRSNNVVKIVESNDHNVSISASDGVIIIKGRCGKLTVSGSKNEVQCDYAKQIDIIGSKNKLTVGTVGDGVMSGNQNEIRWGRGLPGKTPELVSEGDGNSTVQINGSAAVKP